MGARPDPTLSSDGLLTALAPPLAAPRPPPALSSRRSGADKPVIRKALVELDGPCMRAFRSLRDHWAIHDCYRSPGPIQVCVWGGGWGVGSGGDSTGWGRAGCGGDMCAVGGWVGQAPVGLAAPLEGFGLGFRVWPRRPQARSLVSVAAPHPHPFLRLCPSAALCAASTLADPHHHAPVAPALSIAPCPPCFPAPLEPHPATMPRHAVLSRVASTPMRRPSPCLPSPAL